MGWGNWQYSDGQEVPSGKFTCLATVTGSVGSFTGTAVLTKYDDGVSITAESIPSSVHIGIIVNPGAPDEHPDTVTCNITGFQNFSLESGDAHFLGKVNIIGNFDLKGHNLRIDPTPGYNPSDPIPVGEPGDLIHQSGQLNLGGGRLDIVGSYFQQRDVDGNGIYETYCDGSLRMNNVNDYMLVGGTAQFFAYSYFNNSVFSDGTLEVRGNFMQKTLSSYYGSYCFQAYGAHRVWLHGASTQTVTFDSPGISYFNILEVTNPNPLVFGSSVQANRVIGVVGVPLMIQSLSAGGISGTFETDITYTAGGDFEILSTTDLNGHSLTLTLPPGAKVKQNGSLSLSGATLSVAGGGWNQKSDLNLGGGHLTIPGDYIHQSGLLYLNGGRLDIVGSYLQQRNANADGTYETYCEGSLRMNNVNDYMLIGGRAQFFSYTYFNSSEFSAGTLELKGDFVQKTFVDYYGKYCFRSYDAHKVKLSGSNTQTVSFDSPGGSYFNILEVTNPNPLVFGSSVQANRVIGVVGVPLMIQSLSAGGISGSFETDITYSAEGDFEILSTTDLNGHSLTLTLPPSAKVKQNGPLSLSGATLSVVGGGWNQKSNLNLGGGHLTIPGDYIHQSGPLNLDGGRLDISGNYLQQRDANADGTYETYCNGRLTMNNAADYMLIGGDAQFWTYSHSYSFNVLEAGTLELKGNFLQKGSTDYYDGSYSYYASGMHRTLLSGPGMQNVTFERSVHSHFNILKVTNPLADTSIVSVVNNGTLNLDYTGTDVIAALYLGGTLQANGVYDSTNTGGLITGTGKIQVGPFASYFAWTDVNAPGQTTDQDHDHDGVANGIEYFMGKTGNEFTANPGAATDGTVTWPKSPAFSGTYAVQTSADLSVWADVTDDPAQVTTNSGSVVWTRPTSPVKCFVRLLVVPN